jgi:hypothetical protein
MTGRGEAKTRTASGILAGSRRFASSVCSLRSDTPKRALPLVAVANRRYTAHSRIGFGRSGYQDGV